VAGTTRWRNREGNIPMDSVRDFRTIEEMNDTIVDGINSNVQSNDWLFHLGDWSFGGIEQVTNFRERINCQNIVLILGNHDHHIDRDSHEGPLRRQFSRVCEYIELESSNHKNIFCLFHYPIESWNQSHYGSAMLHGHIHTRGSKRFSLNRRMDVGLCGSPEFRPYHIDEILTNLSNQSYGNE